MIFKCIFSVYFVLCSVSCFLLIDSPKLSNRPTVAELLESLESLVEWKKFGLFLPGITSTAVNIIEKDYSSVDDRKMALYSKWLSVDPYANWHKVIDALMKANEHSIAENIKRI